MRGATLVGLLLVSAVTPVSAHAQATTMEISLGATLRGPASAGVTQAELITPAGGTLTLFEATHRTTAGPGIDAGLLYRLDPRLAVELSGAWTTPDVETRISADVEGAGGTTLAVGMHRFSADAGVIRHFGRRGAAEPYLRVGAGWFRELTTDRALVENGVAGHAGGGFKYWLREGRPGLFGHLAFRADLRLTVLRGGITLGDTGTRWSPSVSAAVIIAR